jgi:coupling of ubiquitin conjugation to ER degradation protein 1
MSGGKWEDTKEKRERELKERKERMILEARRRLIEKQAKEAGSAAAGTA